MDATTKIISLLIISISLSGCNSNLKVKDKTGHPVGLKVQHGIKVVYQIKIDGRKENVGAGLYYVNKLVDAYEKLGITESDRQVHAVFHGDAGYWMLKDAVYAEESDENKNPNKKIIRELLSKSVNLELCASTMRNNGWAPSDVLDGVTIVIGAYPRIIDLQLRGYAYIRF